MTAPILPPSAIWRGWNAIKGAMYSRTVTVPDADLRGKWVLITGANNGIGREAAIWFARSGANVILACRQPPSYETHPDQVVEECQAAAAAGPHGELEHGMGTIEWWECDMADLSSVAALARRWNQADRPLDILVNNAGIGKGGRVDLTKDGFEICHQVNLLSHALLTLSVLPSLARAPNSRIVCTTSSMHHAGVYDLSNANAGGEAYSNNKLYYQIWLTELQRRMLRDPDYDHIAVHGVHPGFVNTGIFRLTKTAAAKETNWFFRLLPKLIDWFSIDAKQGALALVNAAVAPEFGLRGFDGADEFRGGAKYFNRIWPEEPSPYTRDAASRAGVWDLILDELEPSEQLHVSEEFSRLMLA
ncbi:hypothetical protein SLS62_011356 [Diatrype stigma]|uniref:Uncharacterized protein n=1 Tax=Diatrype stigma TaxID=117547 RepID=A0AAN9U4D8_9PEZI